MTTYYWIGGTGFLTQPISGAILSASSGGAPIGGSISWSASTDLVIDGNSGPSGMRISVTSQAIPFGGLDCSAAPSVTFNDAGSLWFHGDVILNSGVAFSIGCAFAGTDQSLTTGGANMHGAIVVQPSGTLSLLDNFGGTASNRGFSHKSGIFDAGGHSITAGYFAPYASPSPSREVHLGTSTVTLTGTQLSIWDVAGSAVLDASSATVILTGAPTINGIDFKGGGFSYGAVTFQNGTGNVRVSGVNSFNALTLNGRATYQFSADQSVNALTANAGVNRLGIRSSVSGTQRVITAQSMSLASVDFRDIDAEGPAIPWSGTGLGDLGNNSNITF